MCECGPTEVQLLGYRVWEDQIWKDDEKVKAVLDWPEPQADSVLQVRLFLGHAAFYRMFIEGYSRT